MTAKAYRISFNETDFITVTFDPPSISAFDADGEPTCGGVWSRDLGLVSPDPEMSFAERDAVHAANRAKIAEDASTPDPHVMHRTILSHAVTIATPETLMSYRHIIGPADEVHTLSAQHKATVSPAGAMIIDGVPTPIASTITPPVQVAGMRDGEVVWRSIKITTLPSSWKIEPV